jgi:hypothetical protein
MRKHIDPTTIDWTKLPTEFRGCQWNDGWEFDAPAVIYYPPKFARFGIGGNTGEIDHMVEDSCMDTALGFEHNDGGLDQECEWRHWGRYGFARRKNARHVVIKVRWLPGKPGDGPEWEVLSRTESFGPPPA